MTKSTAVGCGRITFPVLSRRNGAAKPEIGTAPSVIGVVSGDPPERQVATTPVPVLVPKPTPAVSVSTQPVNGGRRELSSAAREMARALAARNRQLDEKVGTGNLYIKR